MQLEHQQGGKCCLQETQAEYHLNFQTAPNFRHPPDSSQEQPCTDMTLTTTLLSSVNDNSSTVTINFDEMIEVSKEVVAFTFLQMVAEVKLS